MLATNARRKLVLSQLGIAKEIAPELLTGLPATGQSLFSGKLPELIQREVDLRKQAAELSKGLKATAIKPKAPPAVPLPRSAPPPPRPPLFPAPKPPGSSAGTSYRSGKKKPKGRGRGRGSTDAPRRF